MDARCTGAYKCQRECNLCCPGRFPLNPRNRGCNDERNEDLVKLKKNVATFAAVSSLGLVFMAVGSAGTVASASPQAPGVDRRVKGRSARSRRCPYWTAARLESAKPVDVIAAGSAQSLKARSSAHGQAGQVRRRCPARCEHSDRGRKFRAACRRATPTTTSRSVSLTRRCIRTIHEWRAVLREQRLRLRVLCDLGRRPSTPAPPKTRSGPLATAR